MMHQRYSLLRDCFGQSYQLVHGFESPHPAAQRKTFWCPELTKSFLHSLSAPVDYWRHLLNGTAREWSPHHLTYPEIIDTVAQRLVQGGFDLYEFPSLGKRALRNGKGAAFSFVRGPEPFPTDKECLPVSNESDAGQYLAGLHATPTFWHDLLHEHGLLPGGLHPQTSSEGEYRAIVSKLLASRQLLLYRIEDVSAPPKSSTGGGQAAESASPAPGNRAVPLAPETKPATESATAADLDQALTHSRSETEAMGMLGLILAKRRLGHTTDPRYVNRYHGPDDMTRDQAKRLSEWEAKGSNRDSTAVAKDVTGSPQSSRAKNRRRAAQMTKDKAKKVGLPSNRQGGPYTQEEIDLWKEVDRRRGNKQHISVHTNTETGRIRTFDRGQEGTIVKTLDDFTMENVSEMKQAIKKVFKS